jgi:DNA-directed RNA polymerase subunit M/transcription elongation factor TFIIS
MPPKSKSRAVKSQATVDMDLICMPMFGYNIQTKAELFECDIFDEHRENLKSRRERLTKPNEEGSMGACIRCRGMNTFLEEKQTRAADEGKTFTIVCGTCGARWHAK